MSEETMSDEAGQADDERDELTAELGELRQKYKSSQSYGRWQRQLVDDLQEQLSQCQVERDAARDKVVLVTAERDAAERERTESRAEVVRLVRLRGERDAAPAERDAVSEQLWRCTEEVDTLAAENTSLRDTVESLRAKQIHPDLPGLLAAIQVATEQARALI